MRKKGQAAMEFLMTYGWAILAAVIVVGVLWYLLGDPTQMIDNGVSFSGTYLANSVSINPNWVAVEIKNNGADDINITSYYVEDCGTNNTVAQLPRINRGSTGVVNVSCSPAWTEGDTVQKLVTVKYKKEDSSLEASFSGTLTGTVAA